MACNSGSFPSAQQFGAIGGVSPVKTNRSKKMITANELVEQIRHLEAEGNKLRSTDAGLTGIGSPISIGVSALDLGGTATTEFPKFTSTSPSSLSALVDISSEQKTISDLRAQLEAQRHETDRLQSHLLGDGFSGSVSSSGVALRVPGSPSRTGFSTLPSTELFSSRRPTGIDSNPPSHMEKAMKDSQEQVSDLRRRLAEANEVCEQQKRQFRQNVEDLKSKLHETMVNRDSILELRQKESSHNEGVIAKLQIQIQQLQEKCRAQELSLSEASKKADGYSRENYVTETTINQIRLILSDAERRRGKPYFESDPATNQGATMLVHTLERCVQELNRDAEVNKAKVTELESEIEELKQNVTSDKQTLAREHQQKEEENNLLFKKISTLTTEHEKQIQAANERASNARKQATNLQSQLSLLQGQQEQQIKLKEQTVGELEAKVRYLREEHDEDRGKWQEKIKALEHSLDEVQKELAKVKLDRDEAIRNHAQVDSRTTDYQATIHRLERDLEGEKETSSKFWEREGQLRLKQSELESRLEEKQRDVERLEKMLAAVKQECHATVSEKVSSIERQERERHLEKISHLTAQLSEISEKSNRATLELEKTNMECVSLKQQLRDLTDKTDTTKIQYEAATAERKHLTDMLTAKSADFDRVSQERDYYFNIFEQKNNEISQLKAAKERLTVQLEEKEKNVIMLQQQSENITQMMETNSRTSDEIRVEKDRLAIHLQETTSALEEIKSSRETMAKKMKIREKRIKELEAEKQKREEEAELRQQEMGILQQEKETLFKELKESRYEVANITEEKDELKKSFEAKRYQLEKDVGKLQYRLKSAEHDLKLAKKALKTREHVDNSAVKVADKMQKEVTAQRSTMDSLQSRCRRLEDRLDMVIKEKCNLENDKDRLKTSLSKTLIQNQQLSAELEVANSRGMDLKNQINKLETALEKSTVRSASSQAHLERFEQEITRLKLQHQLDMQEAVQKAQKGKVSQLYTLTPNQLEQSPAIPDSPSMPEVQGEITAGPAPIQARPIKKKTSAPVKEDNERQQGSSEVYRDIGQELKGLLLEMRTLISDKQHIQDLPHGRDLPSARDRPRERTRSQPRPRTPVQSNIHVDPYHRLLTPSSELNYYSDPETEDRLQRNRSQSGYADISGYSSVRDHRQKSRSSKHRRSRSADLSVLTPQEVSFASRGDRYLSDLTNDCTSSEITADSEQEMADPGHNMSVVTFDPYDNHSLPDSSYPFSSTHYNYSPEKESMKDIPTNSMTIRLVPDTHELCKRLEEKLTSLTKMGGTLQKENKEMADLIKTQGKKLRKVKESEKKIRKGQR